MTCRRAGSLLRYHLRMNDAALIFDLDGTLWDAAAASTRGWNLALQRMGVSFRVTVDDIRSVSGRPFDQCVETLLPELGPPTDAVLSLLEVHERREIERAGGVLYEGAADGLRELATVYRLFLVSNCPDWYLDAFFRASGLRECFTGWDCHGSSGKGKSRMLLDISQRYRLERVLYVGDTQGDWEAAEEARVEFVYVRYGFGGVGSASLSFDTFGELVQHFLAQGTALGRAAREP